MKHAVYQPVRITPCKAHASMRLELWGMEYSVEQIHEEYQSVSKELIEKVIKALKANRVIKLVH